MGELKITDVRALPGDSAFLVDDGTTAILYDSGFAFTGYQVVDKLKAILGPRELDYIFLTHSHYDHALGSVYVSKCWPKAKVVAGKYAAKIFAKDTAKALMRELDGKFAKRCGVDAYDDLIDNLKVDITVSDGDVIKVGKFEFKVLELPGHTRCSIGFYCEKNQILLSNETIGVYDGGGGVLPSYLVGYQMTLDSIARVKALEIRNILVPHYGLLNEEETRRYLITAEKSAIETADEIVSMLKDGKTKTEIISVFKKKFYNDYVKTIYPRDAMELNTAITIDLLQRELLQGGQNDVIN